MISSPEHETSKPAGFFWRFSLILAARTFVVLLCVALIAIDGWRSWSAYSVRQQEAQTASSDLARALSQHAEDTFKEADTVLVSIVERLEHDGTGARHLQRLHALLKEHVAELPQLHGLFIYNRNGQWIANSFDARPKLASNADRDYFVFLSSHNTRAPFVGSPIISRSTGEWILTLSRRFNHPDGSFAGVVLATIHMTYFNKYYETFDIGRKGNITLNRENGILLASRPFNEKWIGLNMKDSALFIEHVLKARSGTSLKVKSTLDGMERMTSFRHLDRYPMLVTVSLADDEIYAAWLANTWENLLCVSVLAIVLGLMGWRLTKHIELHLEAESRLLQAQENLRELNRHLEIIAMQDSLTGLANRRRFDIALESEFSRAMRNRSRLSMLMIDVDAFKQYNDLYGHLAGDECLIKIAKVVQSCQKRPADLSARYGGEEIAVLLPDTDMSGAFKLAEKIRTAIHDLGIRHLGNKTGVITISCGVASVIPASDDGPAVLISAADRALYEAKTNGRNLVRRASDTATKKCDVS